MSRRALTLALLALLMGLALFPGGAGQQASGVSLKATWDGADIVATVQTDAAFQASLVLAHSDAAGVLRVDGVALLQLPDAGAWSIRFASPQGDLDHSVRLLADTQAHRRASSVFWDDAAYAQIQPLAVATVASAGVATAKLAFLPATQDGQYAGGVHVATSSTGAIGMAYLVNRTLWATASADGGRTWPVRTQLLSGFGDQMDWPVYDVAATGPETFSFVLHHSIRDAVTDWVFTRVDLATGSVQTSSMPQPAQADPNPWLDSTLAMPDGSAIAMTPDGNPAWRMWRLDPATGAHDIGQATLPVFNDGNFATDGKRIALAYRSSDQRLFIERYDGTSWGTPVELTGVTALTPGQQEFSDVAMGADGTVYATAWGSERMDGGNQSSLYVRAPLTGAPSVTKLADLQGNWLPRIAVSGRHVVIGLSRNVMKDTYLTAVPELRESFDGGVFFTTHDVATGTTPAGQPIGFSAEAMGALPGDHTWIASTFYDDGGGHFGGAIPFDPLATPQATELVSLQPTPPVASTPPTPTTAPTPSTPPTTTPTTATPPPVTTTSATTTTPSPTTPSPAEPQQDPILAVSVAVLTMAPGQTTQVEISFYNAMTTTAGSEAPNLTGLPTGVTATMDEVGWRVIEGRAGYVYNVTLHAAPDAPNSSATVVAHSRYATDRPALSASFALHVNSDALPLAAGGGLRLEQVPAGAYIVLGTGALSGLVLIVSRTDAGKWVVGIASLPLYSRITRGDVLAHEVRAGIHAHITANPGARLGEIAKGMDIGTSPLVFHLRVLEREGYVSVSREWTRRRYYATGSIPIAVRGARDVAATLTRILQDEPGLSPAAVAQRLGISRQLARYHLRQMEQAGLVRAQGEGISKGYVLTMMPR